jgi:hypothetical protein
MATMGHESPIRTGHISADLSKSGAGEIRKCQTILIPGGDVALAGHLRIQTVQTHIITCGTGMMFGQNALPMGGGENSGAAIAEQK